MKAYVFGLGQMGEAAVHAMNVLGYEVHGFDIDEAKAEKLVAARQLAVGNYAKVLAPDRFLMGDEDIVISCMPYHKNYEVAHHCIANGLRYCDLGGSVPVADQINALAVKHAKKPIFTDLGLAPGLVNIITEKIFADLPFLPDDILMAVGGHGDQDSQMYPCYYTCNWSIDGLINEYFDDCIVLEDRKLVKKPGMSDPCNISTRYGSENDFGIFAFNTSGGIGSTAFDMQARGVKNCEYKTLRFQPHYWFIKWLESLNLEDDEFRKLLEKACKPDNPLHSPLDIVQIAIRMTKDNLSYDYDSYFTMKLGEKFTAMQSLTAFTLASVADMMANGLFDNLPSKICKYGDIVPMYHVFLKNMDTLGLDVRHDNYDEPN